MPAVTFTVPQAAAVLGVEISEVRRLVLSGRLRCQGKGRERTVSAGSVLDQLGQAGMLGPAWPAAPGDVASGCAT